MQDSDSGHADEGLEHNVKSESLSDAYDAFDSVADLLADSDQELIEAILETADKEYDNNSKEWDKLLVDLKRILDQLQPESEPTDDLEELDEEEEEEEVTSEIALSKKLIALQKRAQTIET